MSQRPRKRRSPEEARREILAAAQGLLAEHGPDAIGLKEVARAAGVSHALVSHYFGTYDALVEEALREHMLATRAQTLAKIADVAHAGPAEWVDMTFEQLSHPLSGRLVAWAILSGRMDREDFFPRRDQGMKVVADAIEARLRAQLGEGAKAPTRDEIELGMLLVFAAALGYGVARGVLWSSLSRAPSAERDRAFRERLAALVAHIPGAQLPTTQLPAIGLLAPSVSAEPETPRSAEPGPGSSAPAPSSPARARSASRAKPASRGRRSSR